MSKLSLDRDKVETAKRLAEQIVNPVQHFIDRHTTKSIERSVLRLLGIKGTLEKSPRDSAPQGRYPLVNEFVDFLGPERLARGAAYWLGLAAAQFPDKEINSLVREILQGKINLESFQSTPFSQIDRACQRLLKPQLEVLRKNRERNSRRPRWGKTGQPLRYVIVATGNIHEDIHQAKAAAEMGADIIAVIRSTAQSLLDYVPEGETTEGFGGTFATQQNFRLMRRALNDTEKQLKRRIGLTNYSSGLCMPEIAVIGALEGVDYLLNDAMYGILFRDINMKRNFVDQFFSRRICALSGITIQTGEDNYLTTAESFKHWYQVLASHFINQAFAKKAGIMDNNLALGHAFEMDPQVEDSILFEWAQAQLVRELFPRAPIKFMPPTRHKTGDIFFSYLYDGMFNLAGSITGQTIQLLGMHTEAIHNPYIQDRYLSLKNANYIFNAAKNAKDEILFQPNGKIARRARQVLDDANRLLKKIRMRGMFRAIEEGAFANVRRDQEGGKGLEDLYHRDRDYYTPLKEYLTPRALKEGLGEGREKRGRRRSSPAPSRRGARGGERKSARGRVERERVRSGSRRTSSRRGEPRKGRQESKEKTRPEKTRPENAPKANGPKRKEPKEVTSKAKAPPAAPEYQPLPRRSLKNAEETQPTPDMEETQKVFETPTPLPRRSLKKEEPDIKEAQKTEVQEDQKPAPQEASSLPESSPTYRPLPRRQLKVENDKEGTEEKEN